MDRMAGLQGGRASARGRRTLVAVVALAGLLGGLLLVAPAASAAAGPAPGRAAKPIGAVHLEVFEYFNVLQVVAADNRIVRSIPIAGNPGITKPARCVTQGRIRVNWDYTGIWKLNYFTRMCSGRGVGTHDIPISRLSGRRSMNAADLGKRPGHGAPLSHGCLRMREVDAKFIYDRYSRGVPVYFIETPWRPLGPVPGAPSAPSGVTALPADGAATVGWTAAATHGTPVSGYAVTVSPGGRTLRLAPTARSVVVTGLTNGVAYTFTVRATSSVGASAASPPSPAAVPYGLPAVPGHAWFADDAGVPTVHWEPAQANGRPLTAYEIVVGAAAPVTLAPSASSFAVPGAVPGAVVRVTAISVAGRSAAAVARLGAPATGHAPGGGGGTPPHRPS